MQKLLDQKKAKLMRLYAGTTRNTEVGERNEATGFWVVGTL